MNKYFSLTPSDGSINEHRLEKIKFSNTDRQRFVNVCIVHENDAKRKKKVK